MEYIHPLLDGGCRSLKLGDVMSPRMVATDYSLKCADCFVSTLTAIPRTCVQNAITKRRRHGVIYQNISALMCAVVRIHLGLKVSFPRNCIVQLCPRRIAFTFSLSPSPLVLSAITFPTVLKSLTRTLFSLAMSSGLQNEAKGKKILRA